MMNDKDKILHSGLLEQYVLGLLDEQESKEAEFYIQQFPELQQHVNELHEAMEQVLIQNAIQAPPHLKQNILSEIEQLQSPKASPSKSIVRKMAWIPAVATTIALLFTVFAFWKFRLAQQELSRLNIDYAALQETCSERQASYQELQASYQFVKNINTKPVILTGTPLAPQASAVIYWNKVEQKGYLEVLHLDTPPAGKAYQLWADVDGKMVNIGGVTSDKLELQHISYLQRAVSLNLTLEDVGQNKVATVEQLIVHGNINS